MYYFHAGSAGPQTYSISESPYVAIKVKGKIDYTRSLDEMKDSRLRKKLQEEAEIMSGEYAYLLYGGSLGLREELRNKLNNRQASRLMKEIYEKEERLNRSLKNLEEKEGFFGKLRLSKTKREVKELNEELLKARLLVYGRLNPRHTRNAVASAIKIIEEGNRGLENKKFRKSMSKTEKKRLKKMIKVSEIIVKNAKKMGIRPSREEIESVTPGLTSLRKTAMTDAIFREKGENYLLDMLQFRAGATKSEGMEEIKSNINKNISQKKQEQIEKEIIEREEEGDRIKRAEKLRFSVANKGEHKRKEDISSTINDINRMAKKKS